jgi:hypothetical protein
MALATAIATTAAAVAAIALAVSVAITTTIACRYHLFLSQVGVNCHHAKVSQEKERTNS